MFIKKHDDIAKGVCCFCPRTKKQPQVPFYTCNRFGLHLYEKHLAEQQLEMDAIEAAAEAEAKKLRN